MTNADFNSPDCEIITIGSELLLGQIVDTNTTYLAQELGRLGVPVLFRTAVGDRLEDICGVIKTGTERCQLVITTGGIGPTVDDMTREAVARVAGADLEFSQDLMDQIEEMFNKAGYKMPENNRRQAFMPKGSQPIRNLVGTAPGFIKEVNGNPVICLPGVPRELRFLMREEVIPWLRRRYGLGDQRITYQVLKVVGIGESLVDSMIGDLMKPGRNPEVGLLASQGQIEVRITARAADANQAKELIQPTEREILSRLGKNIYGRDQDTLEGVIADKLRKLNLTLAVLESFSGGLAACRLYEAGSNRLLESHVIPENQNLKRWLGQDLPGNIEQKAAGLKAAQKVKKDAKADVGLAILGHPEKDGSAFSLKGISAAVGPRTERSFFGEMGGDLATLQQRGAIIGLNTLRLALMDTPLLEQ